MAALKGSAGPFVGLDIGASFIKVVQASLSGGRVQVTGLAVMPVPSGMVDNNVVLDPRALGQEIKQLLAKSGINSKRVVSSVAGQSSLVVRIIPVPKMTRAELNETMKWEIERHVPFPVTETIWDFQPLSSPDETASDNIQVLLAVAQEALVNAHVETLMAAGLQPVAIDVEPLAASRSLLYLNGRHPEVSGVVALVDLGASTSDVSVFRNGVIHFTRTMPIAGRTFTQAISEMTGQPLDHAERLKKDLAHIPEGLAPLAAADFGDQYGGFGEEAAEFGAAGVDTTAPPGAPRGFVPGFQEPPAAAAGPVFDLGAIPGEAPAGGGGGSAFDLAGLGAEEFTGLGAEDPVAPGQEFLAPVGGMPAGTADDDYLRQQILDAITPILGELVTELRRSLDYFRSQTGESVERVILCGGTARLSGLDRFLGEHLGMPVELADPLGHAGSPAKVDPSYVQEVSPLFSIALGLAVREMLVEDSKGQKAPARKK